MSIHSLENLPFHSCQHSHNRTKTTFHSLFLSLVRIRGRHIALVTGSSSAPHIRSIFFRTTIKTGVFEMDELRHVTAKGALHAQRLPDLRHLNSVPEWVVRKPPLGRFAVSHRSLGPCPGLLTCSPQTYWGEGRDPAWAGPWSVVVLGSPVMTVDTLGVWPAPSVSRASPFPWACPAFVLGAAKYGLAESTWLLPDPSLGEGNGVEPAGPTTGSAKRAAAPHTTEGRGDALGVPSPLIPPLSWGEAWVVSPLSIPISVGKDRGPKAVQVAVDGAGLGACSTGLSVGHLRSQSALTTWGEMKRGTPISPWSVHRPPWCPTRTSCVQVPMKAQAPRGSSTPATGSDTAAFSDPAAFDGDSHHSGGTQHDGNSQRASGTQHDSTAESARWSGEEIFLLPRQVRESTCGVHANYLTQMAFPL